jgi:hypothetical protein
LAAHVEQPEPLTVLQNDVGELVDVLSRLRWRLGLERILLFGVSGVIASAAAVIGLSSAAWLMSIANWFDVVWITGLPLLAAISLAVLRWPSSRQAALAADRRLVLAERLGTAVELASRWQAGEARVEGGRFDRLQVRDAVARARAAPRTWLALDRSPKVQRQLFVATVLSALAAASLELPGLPRPGLLLEDQEKTLAMVEVIPPEPALDHAVPLADRTLVDQQSVEQAHADADLAARVQRAQDQRAALETLAQAVGRISAGQPAAEAIRRGDYQAARDQLANLAEEADQLSEAAKQELSRALLEAASATAATDRQLAERERQAAQALRRNTYADQRQALRNLADQIDKSGGRTPSADQLARDVGRLQQQAGAAVADGLARTDTTGADGAGRPGGPGAGTGANPDGLGDQTSRLDTAGQRVEVPLKLGPGPGVRPADGSEDQTAIDPHAATRGVSELVQAQQTGHVAAEPNLVPGEQRPVVRGYFR